MSERAPLLPPREPTPAPPAHVPAPPRLRHAWGGGPASEDPRVPAAPSRFAADLSGVPLRAPAGSLQPKLVVGAPDDAYEREADRVAAAVTSAPARGVDARVASSTPEDRVQRLCPHCSAAAPHAETEAEDEPVRA